MKIIINESQINNLILEYGGNIHATTKFVKYILPIMNKFIMDFIIIPYKKKIGKMELSNTEVIKLLREKYKNEIEDIDDGIHEFDPPLTVTEPILEDYGINDVSSIQFIMTLSDYYGGSFDADSPIQVKTNNGIKLSNVKIYIEISWLLLNGKQTIEQDLEDTLTHELTHLYQYVQTFKRVKDLDTVKNIMYNERYYGEVPSNFASRCSYYFSKIEQAAAINSLYLYMKQNNLTLDNYKLIYQTDNPFNIFMDKMEELVDYCRDNPNVVNSIIRLIKTDEKAKHFFPPLRNYRKNRYHKVLLASLENNLKKFHKKAKQVMRTYLMDAHEQK